MKTRLIALGFAVLNSGLPLAAQDDAISTRFRIVSWESDRSTEVAFLSAGKIVEVKGINNSMRSPFLEYTGPPDLFLYDPAAVPDGSRPADSPDAPRPVAKVRIPPVTKYPLILLVPDPGKQPPYRTVVFEDDPAKFPFGTYFFQNFSKHKVAAEMGGERFLVEPDNSQHLVSSDKEALHLRLAISEESQKGWKLIFDSFYPNWKERRTVIFIHDSMRNGRSRMETRTLLESQASWDQAIQTQRSGE